MKRRKKREDWMWYEDPYNNDTDTSRDWYDEMLGNHGGTIPAPNPPFGTEPPVHTFFGTA